MMQESQKIWILRFDIFCIVTRYALCRAQGFITITSAVELLHIVNFLEKIETIRTYEKIMENSADGKTVQAAKKKSAIQRLT